MRTSSPASYAVAVLFFLTIQLTAILHYHSLANGVAAVTLPVCAAEDEVVVMVDYPHPEEGYRCVHVDTLTGGRK